MVDALVLGTSVAIHGGSSPLPGTTDTQSQTSEAFAIVKGETLSLVDQGACRADR